MAPADPARSLLLRHAELGWADLAPVGLGPDGLGGTGPGGQLRADLRVSRGTVTEPAPALSQRVGEPVYDCHGGAVRTAALGDAGPRPDDRIEHAALIPPELVPDLARLGVRVVTQPGFLAGRGDDFLRDVPPADRPDLYRCATLLQAGIPVALSSDAPFGPLDPWSVIAAAASRRQTRSAATAAPTRARQTLMTNGVGSSR